MLLVEERFQCRICSNMSSNPSPESLVDLAEQYPTEVLAMYEACSDGAARHTGDSSPFEHLPTDLDRFPLQDVNVQIAPAQHVRITEVVETGQILSADFIARTNDFIEQNEGVIDEVYSALAWRENVALVVPTHSQVHDIALPSGQIALGLWKKYGIDDAASRYLFFAKALNWYGFLGLPVPEVARMMGNVVFSLPHSKSGDHFDKSLQNDFNKRSIVATNTGLQEGGKLVTLASGGSTNYRLHFRGKVFAESQGAIHSGTARFLTQENMLALPVACYLDPATRLHTRLGQLTKLETDQDCLNVGIWAAAQYSEMSGIHTFQARTRAQHERFAKTKVSEIAAALRDIGFVAHLTRHADDTSERPEQAE